MFRKVSVPRFTYLVIAICIMASLLLVACSNSSTTTPVTSKPAVTTTAATVAPTTTKPATTATTAPATSAAATSLTPKTGGILKIGTQTDAVVLGNPPTQTTVQDTITSKTCVEALGRYDANGIMTPWLADSWKTNADAKTITITLKKGITFHDGTPFNAAAVKFNIDRFVAAGRSELPAGTTTTVIDDSTIQMQLTSWDNTAIIGMGYFAGPQISPTAWQKGGTTDAERNAWAVANPVGTGPFMFVSWTKTVKQVYKKNPNYWIKGQPYLDGIEWQFFADDTVMTAAYMNKEIDMIYLLTPIQAKNLTSQGANVVVLNTGLGLQMTSVWYNSILPDSPFTNLAVRQAVCYSIDYKTLVSTVYNNYATGVYEWAVPTSQYFNPDFKGYPYNPDQAKSLLATAGYASGLKTTMLVNNDPTNVAVATAIQAMMAKGGFTVTLDVADNARYRSMTSPGGSFTAMCLASQRAEGDPALFFPRNLSLNGVIMNKTIMHPAAIEDTLTLAKQAPDQATKVAYIKQLQKIMFGDYAIFDPLFVPSGLGAKQAYVRGDGILGIEYTQWTPETAWLNK